MSRPRWWRCKLQLIRPRRPGHCLGPAWWAPSVQEGGGRQGVVAAEAAATATATAAAAAAAVVLMVGSGSSCSSGSLSGSGCSLSRGASSSSSSSSIRRRVSPVTAGLLSCTFSRVQRRRLAFLARHLCPQRALASKHAWLSLATAGLVRELAAVNTCTHAASLCACEQAACVHCTRCWVFSHSHAFSFPHSLLEDGVREW